MPSEGLFKDIRSIVPDLIDSNGNERVIPIGMIASRKLSPYRISLLVKLLTFIRDSNRICEETKAYIFNPHLSKKEVTELLNNNNPNKDYNMHTVGSKTYADMVKIERCVGKKFVTSIVLYSNNNSEIKQCEAGLVELYRKYGDREAASLRDNIALNLDPTLMCNDISESQFRQFIEEISPYLKSHMKYLESEIDRESIGYFNYLLSSPLLNDVDKERLDYLKAILGGQDKK